EASGRRLERLRGMPEDWFEGATRFFDVERSRAWVLTRRIAHSAHHRGQLTAYLRLLGRSLYSTYGPTADTGGLFLNGAPTIYRYPSLEGLLEAEARGGESPALPGPGEKSPTERPA
ncbi:MAG TPA: DinB family protein, partial [Thermoanaerobaculia bacterium]